MLIKCFKWNLAQKLINKDSFSICQIKDSIKYSLLNNVDKDRSIIPLLDKGNRCTKMHCFRHDAMKLMHSTKYYFISNVIGIKYY